jgi:hypothetical protein
MSVLARDIDAYNRALAAYQRRAGSYNSGVGKYNESFVRDPSGNPYVYSGEYDPAGFNTGQFYTADKASGQLTDTSAPAQYAGMTANTDSPGYSMLRQNPTGKETKTFTGATKGGGGTDGWGRPRPEYFYLPGERNPGNPMGTPTSRQLDASKVRVVAVTEGARSGMGASIPTYTIEYDVNSFIDKPGEFTETFDKKAPDPTKAQLDRAGQPSLAQQEMGLIGEVLQSRGLKTGLKGIVRKKLDEKPVPATEEPT